MRTRRFVSVALLILAAVVLAGCANKWVTSGKIAMGSKNWDKALADFQKALELNPNDGEVHYYMAECYLEKSDYKQMVSHLNAADTLYPKGANKIAEMRESAWKQLFDAGNNDTKSESYEKASDEFETAIAIQPKNYAAYTNAGYVWQKRLDNDSAYYYFSEAYVLEPQNIKVIENLASLCFNMKKYARADSLYTIILEKDPKHVEALIRRAMIASFNNDYQKAVDFYNAAVQLEPTNCDTWFNIGVLYFQQIKNNEEALKAFGRAVELCPQDVNAHINLNVTLLSMGRVDEAAQNLETFTQDFPNECIGWDLYVRALVRKGQQSKAMEAQKKFEECSKGSK